MAENPTQNPPDGAGAQVETPPGGAKFIFLPSAPRIFVLQPTRKGAHNPVTGQPSNIKGVTIEPKMFPSDARVRYVDTATLPVVKRADHPISPAELAALIRATKTYERGQVVEYEDYKVVREAEIKQIKARAEFEKSIAADLSKKRGKNGNGELVKLMFGAK